MLHSIYIGITTGISPEDVVKSMIHTVVNISGTTVCYFQLFFRWLISSQTSISLILVGPRFKTQSLPLLLSLKTEPRKASGDANQRPFIGLLDHSSETISS